jgi:hypothetical protein
MNNKKSFAENKYILDCWWPKMVDHVATKFIYTMMYRPTARQRLGKHIPAEAYARNIKTSITKQQISKQAFSTTEKMCFLRGPCRGVIKWQRRSFELLSGIDSNSEAGSCNIELRRVPKLAAQNRVEFKMPACRNMSLGAEELNWINNNGKKGIRLCKEDFVRDL